jgi:hypothetical protein
MVADLTIPQHHLAAALILLLTNDLPASLAPAHPAEAILLQQSRGPGSDSRSVPVRSRSASVNTAETLSPSG